MLPDHAAASRRKEGPPSGFAPVLAGAAAPSAFGAAAGSPRAALLRSLLLGGGRLPTSSSERLRSEILMSKCLHKTSTSNIKLVLKFGTSWISANKLMIAVVHGFGNLYTFDFWTPSMILQTKGNTAVSLPFSYASINAFLRSICLLLRGLLRPRVIWPSQYPRFLSTVRCDVDTTAWSTDFSNTRKQSYVMFVTNSNKRGCFNFSKNSM
mmetsp:Transcript_67949/g.221182  ORF Transcript_67949/g.221182 Transcript_67949/m.221182 type:complete len:210 (-) Transcript_67949:396-1025(-)